MESPYSDGWGTVNDAADVGEMGVPFKVAEKVPA